jgi:hypothetical protein
MVGVLSVCHQVQQQEGSGFAAWYDSGWIDFCDGTGRRSWTGL